jgi:hypothetical protein
LIGLAVQEGGDMQRSRIAAALIAITMISISAHGQKVGKLIINPEISEFAPSH